MPPPATDNGSSSPADITSALCSIKSVATVRTAMPGSSPYICANPRAALWWGLALGDNAPGTGGGRTSMRGCDCSKGKGSEAMASLVSLLYLGVILAFPFLAGAVRARRQLPMRSERLLKTLTQQKKINV